MNKHLVIVILLFLLFGCSSSDEGEATYIFIGTIEKIHDEQALVSIEEGEILRSGNEVMISLSVVEDEVFVIGDKVRVSYDGIVRESMPLGINTLHVEKVE